MSRLVRIGILASGCALGGIGLAHAALPPGISGSWYDPAKSGQGFSIDVIGRDLALVSWSATDPDGHPYNLYTEARIEGETMIGRALAPRGLRFGAWDRADLEAPDWGELRIDFSDCDNAVLTWTADGVAGAGFPDGSMPLRRLTALAGVPCDFGRPAPREDYSTVGVKVFRPGELPIEAFDANRYGAIDPEGRVWSVEATNVGSFGVLPRFEYERGPLPSGQPFRLALIGEPVADSGALTLDVRRTLAPYRSTTATGAVQVFDAGYEIGTAYPANASPDFVAVSYSTRASNSNYALLEDADRTLDFAGRYRFVAARQGADAEFEVEVRNDGSVCVRPAATPAEPCERAGRITLAFTGAPFVDFVLDRAGPGPALERYTGRGWLQSPKWDPERVELVLVGTGPGESAWGLAAVRQ